MDTQKHTHITPLITREDFQAGYMKPGGYSLEDIAAAIIDNVTRPKEELTPRQMEGLRKFKYHGSWNLAQPEDLANLHKFFDIFNDVYFNGVLTGHCKLEWFDSTARGVRRVAWGICELELPRRARDPRFKFEKPWAPIGIRKVDGRYNKAGPSYRVERYLNCLAHEMLHAVFVVYACGCINGCRQKADVAWGIHGGHDDSFLSAAYAIEKVEKVNRDAGYFGLLGLNLDLYRINGVIYKVQEGVNLPPDSELRRLGLDIKELLEDLAVHRKYNAKEYRVKQHARQLMKSNRCLIRNWSVGEECEICHSVLATMRA
ncbi:uncharacterized protein K444DRAFT_663740 [Hyaloscypha bicolor E]|uniref:SprT-like domain-containing protein n=1 Tax=Hyaloscypha bicolor E TaxID=1095630 RepID=A0A2J6T9K0_9HELO|nr:uncharacterized protein K444DRAFT_663740 [Hyaloscypha bicolor E]PMD59706.1 hypothetical protein K444DRAFT_663740 [Hyaloscypha bicolor E]